MFDIFVSIVTYNPKKGFIDFAIETFLRENVFGKLIIFDNNSPKKELIDRIEQKYKNNQQIIFYKSNKNIGFGAGHNAAFRILCEKFQNAKYYLVMNPDVTIIKNSLKLMINYLEKNKDTGVLVPKIFFTTGEIQKLNRLNPTVFDAIVRRFFPSFIQKLKFSVS